MFQLKTKQVCLFLIGILPITKFFMMNSVISKYANNDMWISVLINLLIDYLCIIAVIIFYQREKTTFIIFLKNKFGNTTKNIVLFFYAIYFLSKAIIPIYEQKEYVLLTLYITMPKFFYFIPFFFASYYLCTQKLRAVGRVSELLFWIAILGYLMLISLSIQNTDFGAIFPINYNNTSGIIKGSYHSLNWFGDGAYLLFLVGEFEYKKGDGKKLIIAFLLSCIIVLIFSIMFYCVFSSISYRQRIAMTEVSKYSTVINNTGRFDYIGIMLILFANIFSLSLPLFFACRLILEVFSIKKKWLVSIIVNGLAMFFLIFTENYFCNIENFILNYLGYFFLTMGALIPLILPLLTIKKNHQGYSNSKMQIMEEK